ncbi:MAG: NAD(P)H-dependent oxidoreductase [Eubacteriaceae bacterium]|nr:NAD(P)H-dependent oxidoreductase [Eubacteriaceae bacterium]
MNIAVIIGTEAKGCTYSIKEAFLKPLRGGNEIVEYTLPKDMPHACIGCKACFMKGTEKCPHAPLVMPIWDSIAKADLLVIAAPVYGLGIPSALKALLDHFCVRWMVHRPELIMNSKRAVVLTNCVGPFFIARAAQRDIMNSLSWMGISKISRNSVGLIEGIVWEELSEKRRTKIVSKVQSLAARCSANNPPRKNLKTRAAFFACKLMHKAALKSEEIPSLDNRHWIDNGWIKLPEEKMPRSAS